MPGREGVFPTCLHSQGVAGSGGANLDCGSEEGDWIIYYPNRDTFSSEKDITLDITLIRITLGPHAYPGLCWPPGCMITHSQTILGLTAHSPNTEM